MKLLVDHGPVIGALIGLFTAIFGENGFGIRIFGVLMITGLGLILYRFGEKHFSRTTGVALSLTIIANMLTHTNGVIVTPDAPMAFFTVLAIMTYYLAFFVNRKYFYLAGVLLGLAMLSKVSAVFPAFGIALYPLVAREKRMFLTDARFYLSFAIALIVFMPFLIWNYQNDFVFFRYQGAHVARGGSIVTFLELWAGLVLVTGPVFFYYAVIQPMGRIVRRNFGPDDRWQLYFAMTIVVPLLYFGAHSLVSKLEMNWPAPVFCGGIFLFGILAGKSWDRMRKRFRFQLIYSLVLITLVTLQVYVPILPVKGKNDITARYFEYTSFKDDFARFLAENPEAAALRVVANNYQIPSMVNLYQQRPVEAICLSIGYHETLYGFHYPDHTLIGDDFLVIAGLDGFPWHLRPHFEDYRQVGELRSMRRGEMAYGYSLWIAQNYTGKGDSTAAH